MSKFNNETIARWKSLIVEYTEAKHFNFDNVKTGVGAWTIAHQVGIVREAYRDRDVVDAHIVTALKKIFPNAVFKDTYSY